MHSTKDSQENEAAVETLQQVMRQFWGYDSFRPLQRETMLTILQKQDSVVVLPTGGGKSLCFQAPAVCHDEGLAVVVSPLISLMKDQVDALLDCGINAAFVNSSLSAMERRDVADRVRSGDVRLLYVAPERLVQPRMLEFLRDVDVRFIAVDEAHCISQWGHDFRPEYRALGSLREALPNISLHAFTATATEHVRTDIARELQLRDPEIIVGDFDRPNLNYRVERRAQRLGQIRAVMDRHPGESGIIYCISKKDVDSTSRTLNGLGYKTLPYHAGLEDSERKANQDAFISEETDTIVATVAFGMGIDKSNVRYVIHGAMPKSLEHYQQEAGRAGRDGLDADCTLIYSMSDFMTWQRIIEEGESGGRAAAMAALKGMADYCAGVTCRHRTLVEHFGQQWDRDDCGACDVCRGDLELVDDALLTAQKIISSVVRQEQRYGAEYTAMVLKGSQDQRILQNGHDKLSTYNLLAEHSIRAIRDWIEQLVAQGYLRKTGEYSVLQLTELSGEILRGETTPRLLKPAKKDSKRRRAATVDSWDGVDRELFDQLRQLRRDVAAQKNVPPYIVFSDASLRDMARRRPTTLDGFREVKGVGDAKLKEYGNSFLAKIRDYSGQHSVDTDIVPPDSSAHAAAAPVAEIRATSVAAFEFFRRGDSIAQVVETIGRVESTVRSYLVDFIRHEHIEDCSQWVDPATISRVREAALEVGVERLKPIREALNEDVSYEDIRLVVACLENQQR